MAKYERDDGDDEDGGRAMQTRQRTWDAAAHIWIGACHRARTCESHKLVTSFVDHKTANCGDMGEGEGEGEGRNYKVKVSGITKRTIRKE